MMILHLQHHQGRLLLRRSATAQQGSVGNQFYYARSANVTNLVSAGGAGTYTTGAVPVARTSADPTISRSAGWTLEVVYQNASLPLRNLSVYAGQEIIDASSPPVDATISGFATPATGAVTGRVLVTAQEGDSNIVGDQLRFGPNAMLQLHYSDRETLRIISSSLKFVMTLES